MYCEKCGKLNNDSAQYCVSCGNPLNFGDSAQPNRANNAGSVSNGGNVYQFNQNANTTSNAPNIKMSFDKKKVIGIVTVVLACLCLILPFCTWADVPLADNLYSYFGGSGSISSYSPVFICIYKRRKHRRWLFNILVNNFDFGNCGNGIESRIHY